MWEFTGFRGKTRKIRSDTEGAGLHRLCSAHPRRFRLDPPYLSRKHPGMGMHRLTCGGTCPHCACKREATTGSAPWHPGRSGRPRDRPCAELQPQFRRVQMCVRGPRRRVFRCGRAQQMLVVRNKQRDAEEVREMPEHLVSLFSDPPKMVRRLTHPRPLATAMQTVKSRIGLCTNKCVKLVRLKRIVQIS